MSITDTPSVSFENTKIFDKLFDWLYERIWPEGVLEEIGHAFDNFRNVLFYFRRATGLYMAPERVPNRVRFVLEKPWLVITYRTQEAYDEAGKYYDSKCSLFSYLVLELTRAANYINILIRQKGVDPLFRLEEGMLINYIYFNRENLLYYNKNYIYPFKFPERFEELLKS
jgi:hypothetical protein